MKKLIRYLSLCLAICMIFGSTTGCKKNPKDTDSDYSSDISSDITNVDGDNTSSDENTASDSSNTSENSSTTGSNSSSGNNSTTGGNNSTTGGSSTTGKVDATKYKGTTVRYATWKDPNKNEDGTVIKKFEKKYGINVQIDFVAQGEYAQKIIGWITEFDEELFGSMVEEITVPTERSLCFKLIGGLPITEMISAQRRCRRK